MGISMSVRTLAAALAALSLATTAADAAAVRTGFTGTDLPRNDDSSTGAVNIGFTINYFGSNFTQTFVNNNGNITFNSALGTFTPFALTGATSRPIIAPFFADVDTRNAASGITNYGNTTIDGRSAFFVNWLGVGYFSQNVDKLNTFQLLLIERGDTGAGNFDIEFNYDQIQWETGAASGGSGNGLGGSSARVGYSNGTGVAGSFFELAGSGVNGAFLDTGPLSTRLIANMLNSNVAGRYVFNVRGGVVSTGEVPVPGAVVLMLTGLAALSRARRRKAA